MCQPLPSPQRREVGYGQHTCSQPNLLHCLTCRCQACHAGRSSAASLAATAAAHSRSRADSARGRSAASTSSSPLAMPGGCALLLARPRPASACIRAASASSVPSLPSARGSSAGCEGLTPNPDLGTAASGGSGRSACSSTQRAPGGRNPAPGPGSSPAAASAPASGRYAAALAPERTWRSTDDCAAATLTACGR